MQCARAIGGGGWEGSPDTYKQEKIHVIRVQRMQRVVYTNAVCCFILYTHATICTDALEAL